ncbi:hypothetical protein OH77DRAFT_265629 [Trametes cingulata]|nr:hypothetical protein OH77DRAFT_265629 [Trametes cingulata]
MFVRISCGMNDVKSRRTMGFRARHWQRGNTVLLRVIDQCGRGKFCGPEALLTCARVTQTPSAVCWTPRWQGRSLVLWTKARPGTSQELRVVKHFRQGTRDDFKAMSSEFFFGNIGPTYAVPGNSYPVLTPLRPSKKAEVRMRAMRLRGAGLRWRRPHSVIVGLALKRNS